MNFDLPTTAGIATLVVVAGAGGLIVADVMPTDVVAMMVLPSMIAFALLMIAIGVKHGEYRATR